MEVELLKKIDNKLELIVDLLTKNSKTENSNNKTNKSAVEKPKEIKVFKSNKKTIMSEYQNAILLYGNTYDIKHLLKSFGGKWNGKNKGWVLPIFKKDRIINLVKNLVCNDANINKILKDDSGEDYEFVEVKNDFLDDSDSD